MVAKSSYGICGAMASVGRWHLWDYGFFFIIV